MPDIIPVHIAWSERSLEVSWLLLFFSVSALFCQLKKKKEKRLPKIKGNPELLAKSRLCLVFTSKQSGKK